jgi:SAM-dependent methyltransferase
MPIGAWLGQIRSALLGNRLTTPATAHPASAWASEPRTEPVSRVFGFDRGKPIDRYYIENFLNLYSDRIAGRVLEIGDRTYTRQFGGPRVQNSDVLNLCPSPGTTIVADLTNGDAIPSAMFDCFICTQTLPFVTDVRAALRHAHRIIRPGGTLLLTAPGISQISRYDADRWGDYWRFTPQAIRLLLDELWGPSAVRVVTYGNLRAAIGLLEGLATHEVPPRILDIVDEDYPVIAAACATKAR